MTQKVDNGILREMTTAEQLEYDNRISTELPKVKEQKLKQVRLIRNQKLSETDWLVISEQVTDAEKTWRENLRKIPQDYTTENQYDLLLARDSDGKLTHSIWSKP